MQRCPRPWALPPSRTPVARLSSFPQLACEREEDDLLLASSSQPHLHRPAPQGTAVLQRLRTSFAFLDILYPDTGCRRRAVDLAGGVDDFTLLADVLPESSISSTSNFCINLVVFGHRYAFACSFTTSVDIVPVAYICQLCLHSNIRSNHSRSDPRTAYSALSITNIRRHPDFPSRCLLPLTRCCFAESIVLITDTRHHFRGPERITPVLI